MHQHVSILIFDFKFIKNYYSPKLNAHKKYIIKSISSILKDAKFWVLQFYPLKDNLILEIGWCLLKQL
jgi:hypothetical protein